VNDQLNIALVVSQFNPMITQALREGAVNRLLAQGVNQDNLRVVMVPGAIEIPLVVQRLAKTQHYDAIIALGAVIRGETTHYDYVCQQASYGCQRVALGYDLPVIFGVLTTENEAQAWDRLGGRHGHKGVDVADAALAMCQVLQTIA
jgi:6,7-dimethyl-8-ribityllumazine synthase